MATTPPSACARWAAEAFRGHGARTVLDLGCGAGRDTGALAAAGLRVAGADAARAGLSLAGRLLGGARPAIGLVEVDARRYDDTGCTGMAAYHIWRGLYAKGG